MNPLHENYEAWAEKYKPIKNSLNEDSSFDGTLYETYGPELGRVTLMNRHYVWTLVDNDNGEQVIIAGRHFVNRLGYFITCVPWTNASEEIALEEVEK